MRNYLVAILVLLFIGLGCGELNYQHFQLSDRTITGIVRIYLHEPGHYSFLIKKAGTTELLSETFSNTEEVVINNRYQTKPARIFMDVKKVDGMWAKIKSHQILKGGANTVVDDIEIHIHSSSDIDCAGWNHGKFGSGQTVVIE